MSNTPYTQKRTERIRGPQSEEQNKRIEENYKDLVYLMNKMANLEYDLSNGYLAFIKDLMFIANAIEDFDQRLAILEAQNNSVAFFSEDQLDTSRFDGTAYEVSVVDRCTYHRPYHILSLPQVTSSSISKVKFSNGDGTFSVPSNLEMLVSPVSTTADSSSAVIDTSNPFDAVIGKAGKVWDRNVIVASPDLTDGAQCYLYVKLPEDVSAIPETNCLSFTPFPLKSVDILEIAYSTDTNISLGTLGTQWTVLNNETIYYNVTEAVGKIAPGAWDGDEILESGPKKFYFEPKAVTAFRIKLRQLGYVVEDTSYIYSYGLANFDARYDKFLSTGKVIIRFDAPDSDTISSITSVTPQMWNVPEYLVDSCFSYRVIWETSYDSDTYTLTPVALSQRVWLEITLNSLPDGGTPSISGVVVNYS